MAMYMEDGNYYKMEGNTLEYALHSQYEIKNFVESDKFKDFIKDDKTTYQDVAKIVMLIINDKVDYNEFEIQLKQLMKEQGVNYE